MQNYYDPGTTIKGYIQAEPGRHGACRFVYAPSDPDETAPAYAAAGLVTARMGSPTESGGATIQAIRARNAAYARLIVEKVREWDIIDGKGQPVPITAANLRRIPTTLFFDLANIVIGARSSDPDPADDPESRAAAADDDLDSWESGVSPGEVRRRADEGN